MDANVVIAQLGGAGRLKAMVNARDFTLSGGWLTFKIMPCKGSCGRRLNVVRIGLDAMDLYVVEVGYRTKNGTDWMDVVRDVYAEDLKRVFEGLTGLYLSL